MMWLSILYTEDPKTRKVVKVVKSFSLKDENIGARLIEAFEKDEEYAETAIKDMPKGRGKAQKSKFLRSFIRRIMRNVLTPLMSKKAEV